MPRIRTTLANGSGTYRVTINVPAPTNVTATDWANISAALAKAAGVVATGGSPEIVFQSCPYNSGTTTLTPYSLGNHTIPIYQGVTYRGVKPHLSNTANASSAEGPGGDFAFVGGTVFLGDGTAPAMAVNNVDAASPAVGWQTQVVSSVGIFGFGFDGFTYGIQAGAQNVLGVMMSQVDEVYARNCSVWGFEFKNPALSDFGVLMACLCQNGVHIAADMPSATYSPGNSTFKHLYVAIPQDGRDNRKCRGVYLEAHATTGTPDLNELDIRRVQVNSFNVTQLSVTATFTNTSANIAVPDGTLFAPGYWVQFATSQAGFSANRNYVVVSVSGNNLTLALSRSQSAIVASATSTATLKTSGFPSLDIGPTPGGSATSGWYVTNTVIGQADTEGTKVGMVLENLQGCLITQCNVPGTFPAVIGRRANTSILRLVGGGVADFDGTTAATCLVFGTLGTELQQTPAGLWWDNVANLFRLSGGAAGNGTGLQIGVTAADKVGHFGSTPVVQPARAGQLTDSSGGTSGGNTVAAVTDVASAANAVATLTARLNSLEAKLSAAGGGVGITA